jgi:hypothetical protein
MCQIAESHCQSEDVMGFNSRVFGICCITWHRHSKVFPLSTQVFLKAAEFVEACCLNFLYFKSSEMGSNQLIWHQFLRPNSIWPLLVAFSSCKERVGCGSHVRLGNKATKVPEISQGQQLCQMNVGEAN